MALLGLAPAALAATPVSGSVDTAHPSASFSAGPFLVPNPSGTAGAVTCNALLPCDNYTLNLSVPAGYDTDHTVAIQVGWANSTADFDVYVLNAAGAVVATAASNGNPETAVLPAVSGTYTVRVVPFAPLGQSITGKVSIQSVPLPPPPSTEPAPVYRAYVAPAELPRANEAGEPSIGVNWKSGAVLYQSNLTMYRVRFDDTVSPATATWADKSPANAVISLDPILFTDSTTGRTFSSQLAGKASLMSYTDDDGENWTPSMGSGINSGVDHQTVGGGPFGSGLGGLGLYPRAVYYCSQDIADASCAVSRDGGLTFGVAVPMYSLLTCGGLHGHIKVAPDGTAYVPNKGCNGNQAVAVTTDNGLTWSVRPVPTSQSADSDPSVGIGSDGTVYFGYQNADGHPHVAVSHDKGLTWKDDQDVGAALGIKNVVFPAVVAGDGDRAAFAFLGTTTGGNYQDATNFQGVWHLYIAHTYDGGKSWVTADATPEDPVQRGSICTGGTTCGNDRNLLDFMDVTVDREGRVLVGYADGCTGACVQSAPNSFSAYASIARQSSGQPLFRTPRPVP
ncbi:sialidase family protein [Hyalangium sp.]|uniref:sialidase family protein n=1 Tax=Hyalangium sp. TaxID=2028555 RepID=UPI00389A1747